MIDIPWKGPWFKPLTPKRAIEYLQNKRQFLSIWNQLIPYHFKAEELCRIVNKLRMKRIAYTEKNAEKILKSNQEISHLKQKKKEKTITAQESARLKALREERDNVFSVLLKEVFDEDIWPRIKNSNIGYREVNQLLWSLVNIAQPTKEKMEDITETANEDLTENFAMERYETDILIIMDELIHEFFTKKETGNAISEWDKKDYGQQARNIFLTKHKKDIEGWIIDIHKLSIHLHNKKVL